MEERKSRKRKLLDGDFTDDYSGGIQTEISKFGQHSTSGRQHTIDSDDEVEDDEDYNKRKHDVLDEEEIEGQEDGTLEFDGETKITPFNMKDELEEGYFDGSGMYIWNKKDASEIKDSWLDSIDWMQVKQKGNKTGSNNQGDENDQKEESVDVLGLYKKVLELLKPGETVLKAIKRLGGAAGKQLSASERLKQKKQAAKLAESKGETENEKMDESASTSKPTEVEIPQSDVVKLTELADTILSATGNMDVYQETYESVNFKIKREESRKLATAVTEDDDMFGDGFETKNDEKLASSDTNKSISDPNDEVEWEFKWEDKEDAPIYGPHSSSVMNSWVSEGYFKDGVFVRKCKQEGPFYSSKRVDFELYC